MFSFFKRLWRILVGNLHDVADKFEEPIKMTKQGIRELKGQLDESIKSFAEVKATAIRSKNAVKKAEAQSQDYKRKAMALLQRAQSGKMDAAEAERLAGIAMAQREQKLKLYKTELQNKNRYDKMVATMDAKIKRLKSEIAKWENELKTLEARQKAAKAGVKINQAMAGLDSSKTLEMLEKTRERVENQEALAEAYGDMADQSKSIDEEIDTALEGQEGTEALNALKEEMGLLKKPEALIIEDEEIIALEKELIKNEK